MNRRRWFKPFPIARMILSLLVVAQGLPVSAVAQQSVPSAMMVRVRPAAAGNPAIITDLTAVPDYSAPKAGGRIMLQWSAPAASDGNGVYAYTIRYATYAVTDVRGDMVAWWNNAQQWSDGELPAAWGCKAQAASGQPETVHLTGLVAAQRYWFCVRSYDRYHQPSDFDAQFQTITNQATAYASPPAGKVGKIGDLSAEAEEGSTVVILHWAMPQFIDEQYQPFDGTIAHPGEYCIQYSTVAPPADLNYPDASSNWADSTRVFLSTSAVSTGDVLSQKIVGLAENTVYYFHVFTRNEEPGNWSEASTPYASVRTNGNIKPVRNLQAVARGSSDPDTGSTIALQWTNPASEPLLSKVAICYSSTTWPVSPSWPQKITIPGQIQDTTTDYCVQRLLPRTTYYFSVYTVDANGLYSTGESVSLIASEDLLAPDVVTGLTAEIRVNADNPGDRYSIRLAWTKPGQPEYRNGDYSGGEVYYSAATEDPATHQYVGDSVTNEFIHHGLSAFTTYYYSVASYDVAGNTSTVRARVAAYIGAEYAVPDAPVMITGYATANEDSSIGSGIYLKWTAPATPTLDGVRIVSRTDRYADNQNDGQIMAAPSAVVPLSVNENTFSQLQPRTTYYVSLFARSSYGLYSAPAKIELFTDIPWYDTRAPFVPLGLKLARQGADTVKLSWKTVCYNADGTIFSKKNSPAMQELYGYEIYRSTSLIGGQWQKTGFHVGQITEATEHLPHSAPMWYFKVRAVDASENAGESYVVDLNGGLYVLAADDSYIQLDQDSVADDQYIQIFRRVEDERGPVIKSIEWSVYAVHESTSNFTLELLPHYAISRKAAASTTAAAEANRQPVSDQLAITWPAPGNRAMAQIPVSDYAQRLSLFYHNGLEWLKVNTVSEASSSLARTTIRFSGKYQLRLASVATEFTFFGVMPKIITPNHDDRNDVAFFRFANPKASVVSVTIYDVRGALVKKVSESTVASDVHGEYISWDGTDSSGETVMPGVYLYQLEGEGKVINGTVVVAR